MKTWVSEGSPCALALLFFLPAVQGVCPPVCSCSGSDRNVDCSRGNLTELPQGLQGNITHLNLSHNRLVDLDHRLTPFANLRRLDLSHNQLPSLPAQLPKSLWEIHAAHNRIQALQKLDTAYQWNLKVLDVSDNAVERAVLINNTLASLQVLNLSGNKLWTVPTNIPPNTETVDLSRNSLTQILPGTLARLGRLSKLYLHDNRFTSIPDGAFDRLAQLRRITLYNNPWACEEEEEEEDGREPALSYLQAWAGSTKAEVLGRPCSEGAATLWTEPPLDSGAPTAAENPLFVKAMKAARTAEPPGTSGRSQHAGPELGTEEASSGTMAGQTIAFTSTDRPLVLYPGELSTGKLGSYEAGPAPHTVYVQEATPGKGNERGRPGPAATPLTLSIASGVPTNYSRRPPSTTATTTAKKEGSTTKIHPRAPSRAIFHTGDSYLAATLAAVALASRLALQ